MSNKTLTREEYRRKILTSPDFKFRLAEKIGRDNQPYVENIKRDGVTDFLNEIEFGTADNYVEVFEPEPADITEANMEAA